MPGLTSLISPQVIDLFKRADAGDQEAKIALRSFQDSPELTSTSNKVPGSEPTFGYGPEVRENLQMQSPGLATSLMERLQPGGSNPSPGATPTFASSRPPISVEGDFSQRDPKRFLGMTGDKWKNVGIGLQSGIAGYLQAAHPGSRSIEGTGFAGKWREQQEDALKRRHGMWNTAYTASQQLPAELLVDGKYASLAQAKAALDQDMQDGKVDNEKNVSGFLTELARFKPELDQYSQASKVSGQLGMETQLQKGRESMGLAESLQDKLAREEKIRQDALGGRKDIAEENRKAREFSSHESAQARIFEATQRAKDRVAALEDRSRGNQVGGYDSMLKAAQQRYLTLDPETQKPTLTGEGYTRMLADNEDAMYSLADQLGIQVDHPNYVQPGAAGVLKIQGRTFNTKDPQSMAEALTYLDQLIRTSR